MFGKEMNSIALWREEEPSLATTAAVQLNGASPPANQSKSSGKELRNLQETIEKSVSTAQVRRLEPSMKWNEMKFLPPS